MQRKPIVIDALDRPRSRSWLQLGITQAAGAGHTALRERQVMQHNPGYPAGDMARPRRYGRRGTEWSRA
jgi:hypothetical protein